MIASGALYAAENVQKAAISVGAAFAGGLLPAEDFLSFLSLTSDRRGPAPAAALIPVPVASCRGTPGYAR